MSFITESQLAAYRTQTKTFSAESLENVFESSFDNKAKVFLSHKHDEVKILQDVVALLKKEGVDVYIDWLDEGMPAFTNAKTAHRLKEKIKIADKFILLATEKAINSKWCNWELGLGDAAKYVKNNIALFPITKDNGNFQGTEYLTIYPRIEYEYNKYSNGVYIPEGFYVKFPDRTIYPLKVWLQKIFRK